MHNKTNTNTELPQIIESTLNNRSTTTVYSKKMLKCKTFQCLALYSSDGDVLASDITLCKKIKCNKIDCPLVV